MTGHLSNTFYTSRGKDMDEIKFFIAIVVWVAALTLWLDWVKK